MIPISTEERRCLRELAREVAEIGHLPKQETKAKLWTRHNDLERIRPMVLVFPEGSWREMLPDSCLSCESPVARGIERDLRTRIYYARHLPDDNVIEPVIASPIHINLPALGLEQRVTRAEISTGAFHIEQSLFDEDDIEKIIVAPATVDWEKTRAQESWLQELLGDLLSIEQRGQFRGSICPVDTYSRLRGIDTMFLDLIDAPDFAHRVLDRLVERDIVIARSLEEQGALTLGVRNHYAGSGGTSYTTRLPQPDFDGRHVRLKDQWGFATAQIFSEVSPAMHAEFALRHECRYLALFGLNCYGCCEPLHRKLPDILREVPRLRRVSISPWADVHESSHLLGRDCIFSWKPNPAILAGETWEPEKVRKDLREFCRATRENIVEIIMKDTHTVRGCPERMWEWVRIAREVAEEFA